MRRSRVCDSLGAWIRETIEMLRAEVALARARMAEDAATMKNPTWPGRSEYDSLLPVRSDCELSHNCLMAADAIIDISIHQNSIRTERTNETRCYSVGDGFRIERYIAWAGTCQPGCWAMVPRKLALHDRRPAGENAMGRSRRSGAIELPLRS
jgi:hypothetical protein